MDIRDRVLREIAYDHGDFSCDHELTTPEFLDRISKREAQELRRLLFETLRNTVFRYGRYTMLGVGTVLYDEIYWSGLRKYLEEHDPTKLDVVGRRGEDIDLVLCPEFGCVLTLEETVHKTMNDLERAGIIYSYSPANNGSNFGTRYLTVPKEHIEQEGQTVIRHKGKEYTNDTIRVSMSRGTRDFHLVFDGTFADQKLKQERLAVWNGQNPSPFAVLFRASERLTTFRDLLDLYCK